MPGFKLSQLFTRDGRRAGTRKRRSSSSHPAAAPLHGACRTRRASLHRLQAAATPRLPPELVLYIFELAAGLGQGQGANTAESLGALVKISLLSRATNAWATAKLYRHVTLTEPASAHALVKTCRYNRTLALRIKSLTLDGNAFDARKGTRVRRTMTARMDSLFELCPMLASVTIKNATIFALTDFSNGRNLRRLVLDNVAIADRTTTNRYNPFFVILPDLEHLVLRQTYFDQVTANHFMCPTTMPRLQSLELASCKLIDDLNQFRIVGQYEPNLVAHRLSALVLSEDEERPSAGHALANDWRPTSHFVDKVRNLRALSIPVGAISQTVVDTVSYTLEYLELTSFNETTADKHAQACQTLSNVLSSLPSSTLTPLTPGLEDSYFALASRSGSPSDSLPTTPFDFVSSPLASSRETDTPTSSLALSQLTHLVVPKQWSNVANSSVGGRGEMAWYVQRLERSCEAREIVLQWR
ncbi:hypothetical protein ACM66B_001231 [Microbotryomycetes sp. NB124-2]